MDDAQANNILPEEDVMETGTSGSDDYTNFLQSVETLDTEDEHKAKRQRSIQEKAALMGQVVEVGDLKWTVIHHWDPNTENTQEYSKVGINGFDFNKFQHLRLGLGAKNILNVI